jgi:hypothetical protein
MKAPYGGLPVAIGCADAILVQYKTANLFPENNSPERTFFTTDSSDEAGYILHSHA